jgi:hypothetical protein
MLLGAVAEVPALGPLDDAPPGPGGGMSGCGAGSEGGGEERYFIQ